MSYVKGNIISVRGRGREGEYEREMESYAPCLVVMYCRSSVGIQ